MLFPPVEGASLRMQITRNRLLITLVLLTVAMLSLSSTSHAVTRLRGGTPDPVGTSDSYTNVALSKGPQADSGEPDQPGGSPIPQIKYGSSRIRGEFPALMIRSNIGWWQWIGRVWAARYWGVTF